MGTTKKSVKERFLENVKEHTMTILKDDGVYRHLRFSNNGSSNRQFDLVTWPGHLAYAGDMGDYVFERNEDMFRFFRKHPDDKELSINLGYWSEKVQAYCRDGIREYSQKVFEAKIDECLEDFLEHSNLDEAEIAELKGQVEDEVKATWDNEQQAWEAADGFEFNDDQVFTDFFEYNLTDYTHYFEWCCWAIVWGIQMYDAEKEKQQQAMIQATKGIGWEPC